MAAQSFKVGDSYTTLMAHSEVTRVITGLEGYYVLYRTVRNRSGKITEVGEQRAALDSFAQWASRSDKYESKPS
jgi:hypothetical protein